MTNNRTTLRELSQLLELSISTVSKALSDSNEISNETKNRVRIKAEECNYRHNKLAQYFRRGSTKSIGVIVPSITDDFHAQTLTAIEDSLSKKGYTMLVSISNESSKKETNAFENLSAGIVDGIILSSASKMLYKKRLGGLLMDIRLRLPIVIFGSTRYQINCDAILNGSLKASGKVTTPLIKKNKVKKIALIGCRKEAINCEAKNLSFIIATNNLGLDIDSNCIQILEKTELFSQLGYMIGQEKYKSLICTDDISFNAVRDILKELPTHIMNSIKIERVEKKIDNMESLLLERHLKPIEIGKIAVDSLLNRINSDVKTVHPNIKTIYGDVADITNGFVKNEILN